MSKRKKRRNVVRPPVPADAPLTERETLFVRHYLETHTGTDSAKLAGYSAKGAKSTAWALLKQANIRRELHRQREARLDRLDITLDSQVRDIAFAAKLDFAQLVDVETNELLPIHALPLPVRECIVSYEVRDTRDGRVVKVKLVDKAKMHEILARHVGIGGEALPPDADHVSAFALPADTPDGVSVH